MERELPKPLVERLFDLARSVPQKIAVISDSQRISYGELGEKISRTADLLASKGLSSGDTIILAANNELSFIYSYFATHLLGAIAIPLDPNTSETRYQLIKDQTECNFELWNRDFADIEESDLSANEVSQGLAMPDMDSIADILFTTGTTGQPKGVVLTHSNQYHAAKNINSFIQNTENDIELLIMPLSHSFGLGRLRCVFNLGGTIILVKGLTRPKLVFKALEEERVTGLGMVPAAWSILHRLSGDLIKKYADQLRYIEFGSSPMKRSHKELLMEYLPNTRICMHYGLTEASRATFIEFHSEKSHIDSIGKDSPNVEVRIMNSEGEQVADGEEGELCIKGSMVMQAYWKNSALTEQSFHGEYFRSGDIATRGPDGYLNLIGRASEIINIGGKKVFPGEVEEAVKAFPEVSDCACVSVSDSLSGEAIKAFIVPGEMKVDVLELKKFLMEKLEPYKIPATYVEVESIPYTNSGKIQRLLLKD